MRLHANSEFVKQLAEVLGVENWRRIIIDISYDKIATIYIETLVDENTLGKIDLHAGIILESKPE